MFSEFKTNGPVGADRSEAIASPAPVCMPFIGPSQVLQRLLLALDDARTVRGRFMLVAVDGSEPTRQTAVCWVVALPTGFHAYTTNTGSGTIAGFRLGIIDGRLTRLDEDGIIAGQAGRAPLDAAIDRVGRFFYVLNSGTDQINGYTSDGDGSLTPIPGPVGIPGGATGLAVF